MKGKEGFKRMSIDEMRAKKAQALQSVERALQVSAEFDAWLEGVDEIVDAEMSKVMRELGYNVHEDMTLEEHQQLEEQLSADGVSFEIKHKHDGVDKLTVDILVVQVARTLTFDFKGGDTDGSID